MCYSENILTLRQEFIETPEFFKVFQIKVRTTLYRLGKYGDSKEMFMLCFKSVLRKNIYTLTERGIVTTVHFHYIMQKCAFENINKPIKLPSLNRSYLRRCYEYCEFLSFQAFCLPVLEPTHFSPLFYSYKVTRSFFITN